MASEETDFPEPDSPTIPKISFSKRPYEIECKTSLKPNSDLKETLRFFIFRSKFLDMIVVKFLKQITVNP